MFLRFHRNLRLDVLIKLFLKKKKVYLQSCIFAIQSVFKLKDNHKKLGSLCCGFQMWGESLFNAFYMLGQGSPYIFIPNIGTVHTFMPFLII